MIGRPVSRVCVMYPARFERNSLRGRISSFALKLYMVGSFLGEGAIFVQNSVWRVKEARNSGALGDRALPCGALGSLQPEFCYVCGKIFRVFLCRCEFVASVAFIVFEGCENCPRKEVKKWMRARLDMV